MIIPKGLNTFNDQNVTRGVRQKRYPACLGPGADSQTANNNLARNPQEIRLAAANPHAGESKMT